MNRLCIFVDNHEAPLGVKPPCMLGVSQAIPRPHMAHHSDPARAHSLRFFAGLRKTQGGGLCQKSRVILNDQRE
jgi:hypothetical protein